MITPYGSGRYLVQSATRPEVEHVVDMIENEYGPDPACSCEANRMRGIECWHLRAVKASLVKPPVILALMQNQWLNNAATHQRRFDALWVAIRAETQEQALAIAESLLRRDILAEVLDHQASEYDNGSDNLRVFEGSHTPCEDGGDEFTMIAEREGVELPKDWRAIKKAPIAPTTNAKEEALSHINAALATL